MKTLSIFLFSLLQSGFLLQSHAQAGHLIGQVRDAKTSEPLPFANVFLNNTTLGTVTNVDGEFDFKIKELGDYELVVSFVGYETHKVKVTVGEDKNDLGIIKLVPSEIQLGVVEVSGTRDKEWGRNLKKFKKAFFGENKFAEFCEILNPWVIDFPKEKAGNRFRAVATEPIEIENKALGYNMLFYLTDFWKEPTQYAITGNVLFREIKSVNANEIASWESNRRKSYRQSTQYLFKAIIDHCVSKEGFNLYADTQESGSTISRSAQFYSDLGKGVIRYDTNMMVTPDKQPGFYRITLLKRLEVHDVKERARVRTYQDVSGQVSWINLKNDYVIVNKDGVAINPSEIIVSGDMSSGRVASMLPLNYRPNSATGLEEQKDFRVFQEQIYIHTDKPYYYPGETIWFKGYTNYATPSWQDSLSHTVYVELVDRTEKSIVMAKTLELVNGVFNNDIKLPETLPVRFYYLRAYTNFSRNFGEQGLFLKPIPILSLTEKINLNRTELSENENSDIRVTFNTNKKVYKPREKITVTIKVDDDDNNPVLANLSLSVVDSAQVAAVKLSNTILEGYPLKEIDKAKIDKAIIFPIEHGVNFSGRFLNENKKSEKAVLTVLQFNPNRFFMAQSDSAGIFSVNGLYFYDSASFSVQANGGKAGMYGSAKLIERKPAPIEFNLIEPQLEVINTESPQRILSGYENPKDARMLKEVVIKSSKELEEHTLDYRIKRPYGKPDYILKKKDINASYGNLLLALQGRFPGLIVRQVNNPGEGTKWVVYLQRAISIALPAEVLVTVNDVITTGSPASILESINPNMVESVELKSGINVLYGSVGGNGILAVYTKNDFEEVEKRKNILLVSVPGYNRSRKFMAPDYGQPNADSDKVDYRSTIYWNPEVLTDEKKGIAMVSFFAADLPGKYKVVLEGVTYNGQPVRGIYFIDVKN